MKESVYEFLSEEKSITYEPTPANERATSPSVCADQCPLSIPQNLPLPLQSGETRKPSLRNADTAGESDISQSLGLPQDWIIFPLLQHGVKRQKSVRIQVNPKDGPVQPHTCSDSDPSGSIDIDWDNPNELVKFSARQYRPDDRLTLQQALDLIPPSPTTNLDPICFSIISEKASITPEPELDIPLQILKRAPTLLTESDLYDLRRATRHNIRVVTRNSLGLVTTTALSGVAPQLLIAASINAFCLSRGAQHLHEHRQKLHTQGLRIRKRDISVAVAEGAVVKLALMVITINHDDFLVFANTFAQGFVDDLLETHDSAAAWIPGLDSVSKGFGAPAEKVQEDLGIATMEERAVDVGSCGTCSGGWNEPTKMLLQNIFDVGAVQAGMETAVEVVQKRIGKVTREVNVLAREVRHTELRRRKGVKDDEDVGQGKGNGVARALLRRRSTL